MKYHLITFGCQMNKSDSERIAARLQNIGYEKTTDIKQSDLIIVNMCSVRQSAVDRVYGLANQFLELKKKNVQFKVGLTGCLLNQDRKKMEKFFDFIFNIKDLNNLEKIILQQKIDFEKSPQDYLSLLPKINSKISAFVPIMTGCNNFCSYCVVPYTRGREFSRPEQEIIKEVKSLIKKGFLEIILLGQNVNSYHQNIKTLRHKNKAINFPKLLQMIDNFSENFWLTFLTSHPKDLSDELIKVMAQSKKIIKYLHLPVQSGDNEILKKMNRHYTVQDYKNLIKKIRKKIPGITISTDIIVGFPGETKKQFKNTARLLKKIKFDQVYIAQYSPRAGTKAALIKDDVSKEEKYQREKTLNKILEKTALKNNKKLIGQTLEILVKNCKNNQYYGQTKNFKNVKINLEKSNKAESFFPQPKIGQFVKAKIIKATPWGLEGIIN
jgi:tRNA-2-methylthio-N6-dimethylallyladenosine synthase